MIDMKPENEFLTALNPELPLIASQAAIELDLLIRHQVSNLSATKRLASLLAQSFSGESNLAGPRFLVDPSTATVVSRALEEAHLGGEVRTINDLTQEAWKVSERLQASGPNEDKESLERVRAFCAALSESAASYLQTRYSQIPTHPYRR